MDIDAKKYNKNKIFIGIFIFVFYLIVGVIVYMKIEGYSFLEAIYMVIITISTVGYKEVKPLSDTGIVFTIFFIIVNFLIVGFVLQNLISYLFYDNFFKRLKLRMMDRRLNKLHNHIIICGYGRNGKRAFSELMANNEQVVVIEKNEALVEEVENDYKNAVFIKGDATKEEVLLKAGVKRARSLITTLPTDAHNVFIVLISKYLNPSILVVSRASDEHSDIQLRRAGADYVILPDMVGGVRMAKLVLEPDVIEFLEYLMIKTNEDVNLVEIKCSELHSEYINATLEDLDVRRKTGANVIGMKMPDGKYIFNPAPSQIITSQTKLFVLGTPEQIENFKKLLVKK